MAWKTEGKIGYLIGTGGQGAAHWDAERVLYQAPNANTQEEIEKVFYLPPGGNPTTDLLLVWRRYWEEVKQLVAGTQNVCIEFVVPNGQNDSDITLDNLAIYTADNESSDTVNFGIIHESGLVVYKATADSIDYSVSPKYELSGALRKIQSINNVVLKKGLKYYIHYTNTNNTFKPAYFSGSTGNYLNWTLGDLQSKSVSDLNSVSSYLGVVSDAAVWLAANENDFMISEIGQGGLSNSDAYIRNNVCNNAEIIGKSGETLPATEKDKLLKLNDGDGFMYIGNNYTENNVNVLENQKLYSKNSTLDKTKYKGIKNTAKGILDDLLQYDYCLYNGSTLTNIVTNNHIYQKISNLDISEDVDLTTYTNTKDKLMAIINKSVKTTPYGNIAIQEGTIDNTDYTGYVFKLKSTYTRDFGTNDEGYSCANVPAVANTIYYMTDTGSVPGHWIWTPGIWLCEDPSAQQNGWKYLEQNVTYCFDTTTFADAIQEVFLNGAITLVGQLSDLAKTHYNGSYISNTIRSQTVQTDKKFYLEMNGREV